MSVIDRLVELAREYDIDFSHVDDSDNFKEMAPEGRAVLIDSPSNKLVAIWEEFKGYSIIDSFLQYASANIEDKTHLRQLTYSLLTTVDHHINQVEKQLDEDKKRSKELWSQKTEDIAAGSLDRQIITMENYHSKLLSSKALILMEIDNQKVRPKVPGKSSGQPSSKSAYGLRWAERKDPIFVNSLYKSLIPNSLDPATRFATFDKIFQGNPISHDFPKINWIHQGGSYSLCFLFYLLIDDKSIFESWEIHKLLEAAFTINGNKVKRETLKSNFSRIRSGDYPAYYEELAIKIEFVLKQSKKQ